MRWPWLVLIVVTALWWPRETYWLSDDWIAVHWAADFSRALGDFVHNQYGLPGVTWFYRPLITLSFALETLVAGGHPFLSHLSNAVAHGLGALLVGLLAQRYAGGAAGWGAALVWGVSPVHAGSVLWAVGRVDSFTAPLILLSVWLLVRWLDGRARSRAPAALAFAAALGCKELAMVLPGVAVVVCFAHAAPGRRLRATVAATWPFFVILGLYLGWRALVLGRVLGGYEGGLAPPGRLGVGLLTWFGRVADPLLLAGDRVLGSAELGSWIGSFGWIGFAPLALGIARSVASRRPGLVAATLVLFVGGAAPCVQFWADVEVAMNARYFTLPAAAIATLVAAGGPWAAGLGLAVAALPHLDLRQEWLEAFREARRVHRNLLEAAGPLPSGPVLVAGLPRETASGRVVLFHLGVDRLLMEPFGPGRRVLALRPLDADPRAIRIPYGTERGVPGGLPVVTLDPDRPGPLPARSGRFDVAIDGEAHLSSEVLWAIRRGEMDPAFVMRGFEATHWRVTIFTPSGYLSCVLPDEGGRVRLRSWLEQGRYRADDDAFVVLGLRVPATLDLERRYPVLVEAVAPVGSGFETLASARNLVHVRLDPDYGEFMAPAR